MSVYICAFNVVSVSAINASCVSICAFHGFSVVCVISVSRPPSQATDVNNTKCGNPKHLEKTTKVSISLYLTWERRLDAKKNEC